MSEDRGGPSNPMRVGLGKAAEEIVASVVRACDRINRTTGEILSLTAGLAGVHRADLRSQMHRSLSASMPGPLITIHSDAEIALFATTAGEAGAVVISGTGSVCFGRNADGDMAFSGGWGPIAGDEGGGASIARKALQAVGRASDGRGPDTSLSELAADYFRAATPEDLIVAIYSPQTNHAKLSGFAACVIRAAREGDSVAREILADAGNELGIAVCAVLRRLGMTDSGVKVGTVGGIFNAGEFLMASLRESIGRCSRTARLTTPAFEPAHAAALMAIDAYYQSPSRWIS